MLIAGKYKPFCMREKAFEKPLKISGFLIFTNQLSLSLLH
ncbi:hypothetical protein DR73_3585 [Enterobacteriaceae bacterium ATCC 29904]|nr:hypothetical protein DR73_3585 [Enterobacteriaceae bacterium ATCC 29904]